MASPEPPVALKDHCSIIHDNILYVYSPDAFQTLPLKKNAIWSQERNGVSVTGGRCVKGGLDGDSQNPALYIVGGATNGSVSGYSGLQRYSIRNKKWDTLNPMSQITANRQNHGATYLNASSAILVYAGSQDGNTGLSTETFLMLMYPPYRVQAYASTAPPAINPSLLGFTEDKALFVGGGNANQKVFTFHPDPGWVNLGVTLPTVLPDSSIAQVNLQTLADGSKILQTYYTNETPNRVTRNIITNPGFVPAPNAPPIGDSKAASRFLARQLIQTNYPPYNATNAPTTSRTGAAIASDGNTVALIGGDTNNTVTVFDSTGNRWLDTQAVFGDVQKPLTTSSSTSATSTPTASQTLAATPASSTPAAPSAGDNQTNGLAVLGGVLGGICAFAAILIIVLLWLRSVRRRKRAEESAKNRNDDSPYPNDKPRAFSPQDNGALKPLSLQAQPMGRSPVPSAAISEADSMAMFGKVSEKQLEAQSQIGSKLNPNHGANNSSLSGFFKSNNKTPFAISKPMMPDLGDYKERPSIDLGKATPSTAGAPALPPIGAASVASSQQKADQRKTDEGWAKYFQPDNKENNKPQNTNPYAVPYEEDPRRSTSRPNTAKGAGGGFWPGSGVPSSNRSTKLPLRDSEGNTLTHAAVTTASPSIGHSDSNPQTRNMSIAAPAQAKISSADSISTDHSSDDGYEDDEIDNYSERDSYAQWNPIGNTWSGPSQRPLRVPSVRIGASAFPPPPTSHSEETTHTSNSGASSLPAFPMPAAAIGRADTTDQYIGASTVERPSQTYASKNPYAHTRNSSNPSQFQHPHTSMDYFGRPGTSSTAATSNKAPAASDMSWLNLGTPAGAQMHPSPQPTDARDPA